MPIIDRKAPLTPANARAADVAHRMTESIAPMQQQRMMAAFRTQGVSAILYSRLGQGMLCTCRTKNAEVSRLSPDGKAPMGAINRVLTGEQRFGISEYKPGTPEDDLETMNELVAYPTSPTDARNQWLGDLSKAGEDFRFDNVLTPDEAVEDAGQSAPDIVEALLNGLDPSAFGISDVSCPICFGTSYIGGYSPFRTFRKVLVPSDLTTNSALMLPKFSLEPGSHTCTVTLPRMPTAIDVFRTWNDRLPTLSKFYIDGQPVGGYTSLLAFFDGRPHTIVVETSEPLTHIEIQASLSPEPIYFEFPKRTKSSDISLLEQTEPFQIVVSPDIPNLQPQDIVAESQLGKLLVVQNVDPWNTRNRQMLGWTCQVRVCQPQELYYLLPIRQKVTGQKVVNATTPAFSKPTSGVGPTEFEF